MKTITNKEYEEFKAYKNDVIHGRVLTSDGLRLICESNNYDPTAIGKQLIQSLNSIYKNPEKPT